MKGESTMKKNVLAGLLIAFLLVTLVGVADAYDPTPDFSINNGNPNGVWSYGWMPTDFSSFILYTGAQMNINSPQWFREPASPTYTPMIWRIDDSNPRDGVAPGQLSLHPSNTYEASALRWTAPSGGIYQIEGQFFAGDTAVTQVGIRQGSTWLWQATNAGAFNLSTTVISGESVDFVVYGAYYNGNTPLDVRITSQGNPAIDLGAGSGNRSAEVTIPIILTNAEAIDISALSVDIGYDTSVLENPEALIGPAGSAAAKDISTNPVSPGLYRVSIFSLSNNDIIEDGVVAYVIFTIKADAPFGNSVLDNTPSASDPEGNPLSPVDGADGSVEVLACMAGDCNCDESVHIAEVQTVINMFLGMPDVTSCCDVDGNSICSLDEVIKTINNHLGISPTGARSNEESFVSPRVEAVLPNAFGTIPQLRLGVDTGEPGDTVTVPVVLKNASGYETAGVATDIAFDTNILENPTAIIGPAGTDADKDVVFNEVSPGVLRIGVFSISNNAVIEDGIVAFVSFNIKASADYGATFLSQTPSGSDPYGNPISVDDNTGIINVNTVIFSDVTDSHWAYDYICTMYNLGISNGYSDGTYRPTDNVNRGQMAAFIIRVEFGEDFSYSLTPHFSDVLSGHWAFKYVQKMYDEGITTGYADGTYRTATNVTRGQMAAFIIRALFGDDFDYETMPYFTDVPETHWAFKYVQKMYDEGITTGYTDGTYRPSQNVNRAQMAAFIARAFLELP
jgi:hypothetical protein